MIKAKQDSYWQHKSLFQVDMSTYSLITVINMIITMTLPCSPVLKKEIQIQTYWLKDILALPSSLAKRELTPYERRVSSYGCT